jgi:hypothetical protein
MKSFRISPGETTITDLLQQAYHHNLIVQAADGTLFLLARIADEAITRDEEQTLLVFVVDEEEDNDFGAEVAATKQNEQLMRFLDERATQANPGKNTTLEELRQRLQSG